MKKKGFTLIELMIVLAIIAILAVVIVPKSGIFKSQSKNAGVITNVNTVRAYLETKTGDDYFIGNKTSLQDALDKAFNKTGSNNSEKLINPFDISDDAVTVIESTDTEPTTVGVVVVKVTDTSYTVYGIDNGGATTAKFEIKK